MSQLFKAATFYREKGFSIIPCHLKFEKNSDGKEKCKKPAMVPWEAYQKKPVSQLDLAKWENLLQDQPGKGVAIITGKVSNLLVVDIDSETSHENLKPFLKDVKTVTVRTPGGGWHYYFKYRDGFGNRARVDKDGLDIRAEGGYVLAPPSLYPNGIPYYYEEGAEFTGQDKIAPIPEKLFQHMLNLIKTRGEIQPAGYTKEGIKKKRTEKSNDAWLDELIANGIKEGSRVTEMVRGIGLLKRKLVSDVLIEATLRVINSRCETPLTEQELRNEVFPAISRIKDPDKEKTIKNFNRKFRYVEVGPKYNITEFKTKVDGITNRQVKVIDLKSPNTLLARYRNKNIVINKALVNPFNFWMDHKERKDAEEIVFEPNEKPLEYEKEGRLYLNLWTGFHVEPKKGEWPLFRKHIKEVICGGDIPRFKWLLQWVARLFQDPGGERPGKVPVFRGGQGTGKGTFVNTLGQILGLNYGYFTVGRAEHVIGRFNDDMKTALLIHIDEGTYGGNKSDAGHLKHIITEPTRRIEPKGVQTFHIKNHLNLMISSNMDWVIPASTRERRFCIFDINEEFIQDEKYFSSLRKELDEGGIAAFLYDMLKYKYDLSVLRQVPYTEGTRDQIIRGSNNVIQFWYKCLYLGYTTREGEPWETPVVGSELYQSYLEFVNEGRYRGDLESHPYFGRLLNKNFGKIFKQTIVKGRDGKRVNGYILDPLTTCRKQFDMKIINNYDESAWPEEGAEVHQDEIPF